MSPLNQLPRSATPFRCLRHGLRAAAMAVGLLLTLSAPVAVGQNASLCPMPAKREGGMTRVDYRAKFGSMISMERRHFTPRVEMLLGGESTSKPGPDIAYTLSRVPNHHRALVSLNRLGQRLKTDRVPDMDYSIDCYFQRAVGFEPDDTVARLLYVQYLSQRGRADAASAQLKVTAQYAADNPMTHFNIGLLAAEVKDYTTALQHAHIAYGMNYPRPELRDLLKREGQWVEPPPQPASAPEAPEPAASDATSNPPT
jgi:hypothetical protein